MPIYTSSHLRHITYIITILVALASLTLYFYINNNFSFAGHAAAILFEVPLSVVIVEIYLARGKRNETFKIYSLSRSYILDNLFVNFNKVLTESIHKRGSFDELGHLPSAHPSYYKIDKWTKSATDLLDQLEDQSILTIVDVFDKHFYQIEKAANLNMVYHNEDFFITIMHFLDAAAAIRLLKLDSYDPGVIVDAIRKGVVLPGKARNAREDYIQLISSWQYMLNNFIYYSHNRDLVKAKIIMQIDTSQNDYQFKSELQDQSKFAL